MLVAISGKAMAGKDTVALMMSYLLYCKRDNPEIATYEDFTRHTTGRTVIGMLVMGRIKKFAGTLKRALGQCIGVPDYQFESREFKAEYIDWLGMTGRQLMQQFASAIRVQMDEDFWVKCLLHKYKPSFTWFISDARYNNEINAVKDLDGVLIRVNRPSLESNDEHISETALDEFSQWDHIIENDGTLEDLFEKCKEIVEQFE